VPRGFAGMFLPAMGAIPARQAMVDFGATFGTIRMGSPCPAAAVVSASD